MSYRQLGILNAMSKYIFSSYDRATGFIDWVKKDCMRTDHPVRWGSDEQSYGIFLWELNLENKPKGDKPYMPEEEWKKFMKFMKKERNKYKKYKDYQ